LIFHSKILGHILPRSSPAFVLVLLLQCPSDGKIQKCLDEAETPVWIASLPYGRLAMTRIGESEGRRPTIATQAAA